MCICWIHIFFEYDGIVFIPSFWKNVSLFEKGLYLVLLKHLKLQNILRVTFAFRRYFLKLTNVSFSMHDQCSRYLKSSANITRLISRYVISAEQKLKMFYLHIWQIWLGDNLRAFLKDYLKLNEPTYPFKVEQSRFIWKEIRYISQLTQSRIFLLPFSQEAKKVYLFMKIQ